MGDPALTNFARITKIAVAIVGLTAVSGCASLNPFSAFGASSEVTATRQAARVRGAESVIVMGYGTPPGGTRAYRATVYITDPALDARALNVALQSRNGPVAAETQRAIEDAILSRARQIRIADGAL